MIDFKKITEKSYIFAKRGKPLSGTVRIAGAKNMVTKIMTAGLIANKGTLTIKNVPKISEITITLELFDQLGVNYNYHDSTLIIYPSNFETSKINFQKNDGNRISILFVAPIISRFGKATIAKPKGCKIGTRKIDFHITGLKKFGINILEGEDYLEMSLSGKHLVGANLKLPFPSVGATENFIITATCARGKTVIENCAIEPEIMELILFLKKCGVDISVSPDRTIAIEGKGGIDLNNSEVTIIPDRIETISYAVLALSTKGDVFIEGARADIIQEALKIFEQIGVGVELKDNGIRLYYKGKLKPINLTTAVYPGFVTDFQQPFAVLLSQIEGTSTIHETIFENRFSYLDMLNPLIKSGSRFVISDKCFAKKCRFSGKGYNHSATIRGPVKFGSGEIAIPDLRAGFALLNVALLSDGIKITNLSTLFRGYDKPIEKLQKLGADIQFVY